MNVSRILAAKPAAIISIRPEASIQDALSMLAEYDIGALVVTDELEHLVGILSERDIVRRAARQADVASVPVGEVMTRDVVVGVPQDDLMSVAHTMTERHFRHLPIVDGRRVIGMVSIGDVLKVQRDAYKGQIDTLETQILAE
ncbi:MAG: CBS domain-containing protein [Candidatus Promineifilaceae bacterium]